MNITAPPKTVATPVLSARIKFASVNPAAPRQKMMPQAAAVTDQVKIPTNLKIAAETAIRTIPAIC